MAAEPVLSSPVWELEQLARLSLHRPGLVNEALKQLLAENEELRWAVVVGAYLDRQINLGRCAELLGLHEIELRQRFHELGVPVRVGPVDLEEAKAEIDSARQWLSLRNKAG